MKVKIRVWKRRRYTSEVSTSSCKITNYVTKHNYVQLRNNYKSVQWWKRCCKRRAERHNNLKRWCT